MEVEAATKRARENEGSAAVDGTGEQAGISAVIPGWFSEISPMWPGSLRSTAHMLCFFTFFLCAVCSPFLVSLSLGRRFVLKFMRISVSVVLHGFNCEG